MRASIAVCWVLLCGCLEMPPAIDETSVVPGEQGDPGAPPAAAIATATAPAPQPTATPAKRVAAPKTAKTCPIVTGRHTFCEGRNLCTRDHDGCEECVCNTENDASRAEFEQTDPWDMRQR